MKGRLEEIEDRREELEEELAEELRELEEERKEALGDLELLQAEKKIAELNRLGEEAEEAGREDAAEEYFEQAERLEAELEKFEEDDEEEEDEEEDDDDEEEGRRRKSRDEHSFILRALRDVNGLRVRAIEARREKDTDRAAKLWVEANDIIRHVAAELFEKRQGKETSRRRESERKSPSLERQVRDLREEVGELRELLRKNLKRD